MHWFLGLRTPPKPRVPFILAALPLVAHPLKLNPRSAAEEGGCDKHLTSFPINV